MAKTKKQFKIFIDEEFCKGCDICVELCPTDVFLISEQINSLGYYVPIPAFLGKCNGCKICELICPEMAVILEQVDSKVVSCQDYSVILSGAKNPS